MYSIDELCNKKYKELLKIAKLFGIKGGRQKTDKLISSILAAQKEYFSRSLTSSDSADNVGGIEMLEDIEFPESFLEASSENMDSEDQTMRKVTERRKTLTKTRKSIQIHNENKGDSDSDTRSPKLKRSNTFEIDGPLTIAGGSSIHSTKESLTSPKAMKHNSITETSLDKKQNLISKRLTRSGTFEISSNDEQKSYGTAEITRQQEPITQKSLEKPIRGQKRRITRKLEHFSENEINAVDIGKSPKNNPTSNNKITLLQSEDKRTVGQKRLTRSRTFEMSPESLDSPQNSHNKRKHSSNSIEKKMAMRKKSMEDIDLSCKEIQTARDIQNIEEAHAGTTTQPPLLTSNEPSYGLGHNSKRRSLRSKLLESNFSLKKDTHPPTSNLFHSSSGSSGSEQSQASSDANSPTKFKKQENSSGIPRFVAYARKKMPDFNRIHEKAFNKMESIDDYMSRKHTRVKSVENSAKLQSRFKPVTSTKKLNLNFASEKKSVIFGKSRTPERRSIQSSASPVLKSTKSPCKESSAQNMTKDAFESKGSVLKKNLLNENLNLKTSIQPEKSSIPIKAPTKENKPPTKSPRNSRKFLPPRPSTPGSLQRRKEYDATLPKPQIREITGKRIPTKIPSNREALKKLAGKNPKLKSR